MMDPLLNEFLSAASEAYATAGWWGGLAAILMFGVRVFRLDALQQILPPRARWKRLPEWAKWALPLLLSALGATILAVVGGVAIGPALIGGLFAAVSSVVGHHATKKVGDVEGAARLAKDPGYQPSPFRRVGSIIVPISKMLNGGLPPTGDIDEPEPEI